MFNKMKYTKILFIISLIMSLCACTKKENYQYLDYSINEIINKFNNNSIVSIYNDEQNDTLNQIEELKTILSNIHFNESQTNLDSLTPKIKISVNNKGYRYGLGLYKLNNQYYISTTCILYTQNNVVIHSASISNEHVYEISANEYNSILNIL